MLPSTVSNACSVHCMSGTWTTFATCNTEHRSSQHTLAQVLAGNRILSAPVVAPSAGSGSGPGSFEPNAAFQEIVCFLDLRDVLCSFLEELDMEKIREMKMLRRMKVCGHT